MKKIILLALITLMTCTRGAGQSMFSGSTDLEVIANEWENITLNGVANGSLVSMLRGGQWFTRLNARLLQSEMAHMDA